ncbi:hypothetical protein GGI35DRAFT_469852 [Trichoderma velutinum]
MTATVADIMKKLSVTDALSLRNNFAHSKILNDCLNQRVDPVAYFQQTFDYPITLIAAIFNSGCILSGSRALEYFFPRSIGPESDWDFYIPAYKKSVVNIVNALQICSVTGLGERTASRILGNKLYKIARAYIRQMRTEVDFKNISTFKIILDSEKNIHFVPVLQVLPCENDKTLYHDLFRRPFSILNSTITTSRGFKKRHLKNNASIVKAIWKYKTRGFKLIDSKGSGALENNGSILGYLSLTKRFHQKSNIIFTGSGRELPISACHRFRNMITVYLNGPNKLRSAAYCSTVGRNVMEHRWEMQTVARSGTANFFFKDTTPWSWAL